MLSKWNHNVSDHLRIDTIGNIAYIDIYASMWFKNQKVLYDPIALYFKVVVL